MSNIFYTSDPHIGGHKKVAGLRGFIREDEFRYTIDKQTIDTDAHDEELARIWDKTVGPKDQVFILGDVSINGSQKALDWIAERPGSKDLIAGNHDPVHPLIDRRAGRLLPKWLEVFDTIQPFARRRLNGHNFLMSHFPYWPYDREGTEPRYEQARLPNLGLPLLHGHTHSDQKFEFPNSLHVGWDAWGELVPQEFVLQWLNDNAARQVA